MLSLSKRRTMSRRRFLKNLGLASAGVTLSPFKTIAENIPSATSGGQFPIVISTWVHGMEANAGAGLSFQQVEARWMPYKKEWR